MSQSRDRQLEESQLRQACELAAFGEHLTADFRAQSFGGRVEGGYRVPTGAFTPYAAVQAQIRLQRA
jgi:uncharacterized protein with beta-barrel porin domain